MTTRNHQDSATKKHLSFGLAIAGGGIAHFAAELANALRKMGARRLTMFAPGPVRPLCQASEADEFLEFKPAVRIWGLNQWKFAAVSWLRLGPFSRRRASLKHFHTPTLLTPDVFTVHGLYVCVWLANPKPGLVGRLQFLLLSALERRILRKARVVAFVSRENMDYVQNVLGIRRAEAFRVVHPGVDCARFSESLRADLRANRKKHFPELAADARWLLFVGHDYRRKGLPGLLAALADPKYLDGHWQVLVFGHDPVVRPTLSELEKKLGRHLVFFDSDRNLPQAFGLSELLMLDSTAEGFPLVLLEAMAAGCIPFVTRFPGTSESVLEGKTGFLFDDRVKLVAEALRCPESQLAQMCPDARAFALDHSWARTAETYEQIYQSLERA